ncbi:MAG: polysaccharide biosynthesis tyrosine autokinase [Actinomycetota bacterium]|nr:polysaccharide biosynthesis tyrosine autokinase [Actinomycetota bacterium]
MSQAPATEVTASRDLREFLGILRIRKWTILIVATLVVAAALFFSARERPLYKSEAKVLVKAIPPAGGSNTFPVSPNLETERELVESESVAQLARDEANTSDLSPESLSVDVATETEILLIAYTDPDPLTAQRNAQAYADAYLEFRRQEVINDLLSSSDRVRQQIGTLNKQLAKTNRQIRKTENESLKVTLQSQANSLVGQIAILQQEQSELTPPESLRVGQVVARAGLPSSPVSPNHLANGVMGLFVGLALGVGAGLLRERLDDRVRDRTDLEAAIGAPVLAVVPRVATWRRGKTPVLITKLEPRSAAAEAYRTLRTGLLFAASQRRVKTVLITSARAGEGKTVTTANLGVALAQTGRRVVLVSADLRKPRLSTFFNEKSSPGLTNVFAGEANLWRSIADSGIPNLKLLPSGPIPGNPAELLGSEMMRSILEQLASVADFVLVDGPPTLTLADAITLAPLTDGVLFVTDSQATRRGAVEHSRQQLEQVEAQVIGAVLNNFDPSKTGAYEYYYADYYGTRDGGAPIQEPPVTPEGTEPQDVKPVWL